ncbi:MAG: response regulator [Bacteroidota bacterium]|nr:response regulator [Bacteroidota bacterium]
MTDTKKNECANAMIVEDEKDLCFLLSKILQRENLRASCVNSITEAKQFLNEIKPEVLFIDNHLPDGSGIDFIGTVKTLYPSTKIIMITAHDSPPEIEKAFDNGADYFISKPFNTETIKRMLNNLALANIA